ncbi:glucohydrolase [Clostridium sp. MCC353]|uniref:glycoside hydrolase family 13 protein n=1 Tax=Clostridium sp. MCC353 TaxID=2592646 RepID=UPI001C01D10F|nr:alpha-glucosidase [Clostridium sp. MCC353]MBT9775532.1 glucohydrolase [Clostridium sp. MCC353]
MKKWWKEAVVYQIYTKSFLDTNGDGIGDLQGIIRKLDYIKDLGVDVIWLNPIYKSPDVDNGYDISDYQSIDERYGTMEDFKQLLDGVHKRGMKLIMDMVLNHTSDEHQWFVDSKSSKDSPYRDYYIWREGKDGKEPNNWGNYFYEGRGSAWEYDETTGEYYLHNYSKKMPDLNWDNEDLKEDMCKMMRWWLDLGVDGFRMDAVNRLVKPKGLPDSPNPPTPPVGVYGYVVDRTMCANQPGIHELLHELNQRVFSKYDIMVVGETGNVDAAIAIDYVKEEHEEIDMVFHFEIAKNPVLVDTLGYKEVQRRWYHVVEQKGWITQYLSNHDTPRQVSRFGNDTVYRYESATMLATLLHTHPGTVYIYQGEELGMTNVDFPSIEYYNEKYTVGKYETMVESGKDPKEALDSLKMMSRDNARTPMQWTSGREAGFTEGTPWMHLNPRYTEINAEYEEKNEKSVLNYYKILTSMRKKHPVMVYGTYEQMNQDDPDLIIYTRTYEGEKWLVAVNYSERERRAELSGLVKDGSLLLSNYENQVTDRLLPYEARVYRLA